MKAGLFHLSKRRTKKIGSVSPPGASAPYPVMKSCFTVYYLIYGYLPFEQAIIRSISFTILKKLADRCASRSCTFLKL